MLCSCAQCGMCVSAPVTAAADVPPPNAPCAVQHKHKCHDAVVDLEVLAKVLRRAVGRGAYR